MAGKKKTMDYSNYTKEDLLTLIENQQKEIDNLKKGQQALEKIVEQRDKSIEKLKKEIEHKNSIEENKDLYANASHIDHYKKLYEEYEKMYKNQLKINKEDMEKYREHLKNMKPVKHNERGAGRKGLSEEIIKSVIELKKRQPELSVRKIESIMAEQGIEISRTKIAEVIKENLENIN